MAEKRMYSKKITETDEFLSLPLSTQALYFHLGMNADDDGFVSSPVKVMRMIGANKNELDLLLVKKYLIPFDNGVVVIRHWRINNYLRSDRYTPTLYVAEKQKLEQLENGSYELKSKFGIPAVDHMDTQYSIDKNRLDENSIEKKQGTMSHPCPSILPTSNPPIIKEESIKHGTYGWVKLTQSQYDKLCDDFNKPYIDKVINAIDEYCQLNSNKNKYKDFNLVIRKAIREKWSCIKDIKQDSNPIFNIGITL